MSSAAVSVRTVPNSHGYEQCNVFQDAIRYRPPLLECARQAQSGESNYVESEQTHQAKVAVPAANVPMNMMDPRLRSVIQKS